MVLTEHSCTMHGSGCTHNPVLTHREALGLMISHCIRHIRSDGAIVQTQCHQVKLAELDAALQTTSISYHKTLPKQWHGYRHEP